MLAQPGESDGTGRLGDRPGMLEYVPDGGADLVGGDRHRLVEEAAAQPERLLARLPYGNAVGKDAAVVERHRPARGQRRTHGRGVFRLDADESDIGAQELDVGGNARGQAAP